MTGPGEGEDQYWPGPTYETSVPSYKNVNPFSQTMPTIKDTPIDPNDPDFCVKIETRLHMYAEEYSRETFPSEHRSHLGASSIGEPCHRKLWYQFRWVKLGHAEGRMRRLWNRGHREEEIFEGFLLWAGFNIRSVDEATGKQFKFSKVNGHYGGSTDGTMQIRWAQNFPIIADYKTFASKYFEKLKKEKLRVSNPKYFAQLCAYGAEFKVTHGLLFGVNKDNDEWYFELVKLDQQYAMELEKKARDIITATIPPTKINENPAYYQCKWCTFQGICHYGEAIEKNCRSCSNAVPSDNATWTCNKWKAIIPKDAIAAGCGEWKGIV